MRLIVVGAGYVGLSAAAVFAGQGHEVVVLESDAGRAELVASGRAPFREPQLEALIGEGLAAGRLRVARDADGAFRELHTLPMGTSFDRIIVVLAVGTPAAPDGSTDERQLIDAARKIGAAAGRAGVGELTLVLKSTAPLGAGDRIAAAARSGAHEWATRDGAPREARTDPRVTTVVNPEFLRAGFAVHDFLHPDRVVIGGSDADAVGAVAGLYAGFVPAGKIMRMSEGAATLVKYASNAMLATRISFVNELARLASAIGADIEEVRHGVGADPRIGAEYLHAGAGYGGSCLPKDIASLVTMGEARGVEFGVLRAVAKVNEQQPHLVAGALVRRIERLDRARIAVWGLSFKGGSDDLRNSPAFVVVEDLLRAGARVVAYDPSIADGERARATAQMRDIFAVDGKGSFEIVASAADAVSDADALAITADWAEFRVADLSMLAATLRTKIVIDGRNLLDPAAARDAGLTYVGIGRGESP